MHSMSRSNDDWRLQGQEDYLLGVTLFHRHYRRDAKDLAWDHDHCEFCSAKFRVGGAGESLTDGYATEDGYRWICEKCFGDFRDRFDWRLALSDETREDGLHS